MGCGGYAASGGWPCSALGLSARGKGGGAIAGAGECAIQFLAPVGDVAGGAVAIEHAEGPGADVGELVKDAGRDVDGLAGGEGLSFVAEAHFAGALDDEVDFFLFLVVPGNLAAGGVEGDVADAETPGLDGGEATDEVLGAAARRVAAAFDLVEVGNDHACDLARRGLEGTEIRSVGQPPKKVG
jgi:hypothetical protein